MNLSELIDTHRAGRSYDQLARDCGTQPSGKRLQQLVRQPIKNFPDPDTVTALARGLRVSQVAVVMAAAESLGLEVGTAMPRLVQLLPAAAGDLTEEQAAAIAHLVRVFLQPAASHHVDVPFTVAGDGPEPTVREVQAARQRLRAVAQDGDDADQDLVDDLARGARERQGVPRED